MIFNERTNFGGNYSWRSLLVRIGNINLNNYHDSLVRIVGHRGYCHVSNVELLRTNMPGMIALIKVELKTLFPFPITSLSIWTQTG